MKINSICNFLAGATLTLLVVFFVKPSFLVTQSDISEESNDAQDDRSGTYVEERPDTCDEACVLDVIDRFKSNRDLKNEYGPNIQDLEAENTAKYIEDKPEIITEIETSLAKIKSQSERNSILTTLSYLPTEQMIEISERLMAADFTKAKIDGVNMLFEASRKGADVKGHLESFINSSKDSQAVFSAMNILRRTNPNEFESISGTRLAKMMADTSNEEVQAKALITKIRFFTINDAIKKDIVNGLNSKSVNIQSRAIVGLDHVLNEQYKRKDPAFDWRKDANLRAILDGIIIDKNANLENKREILNVIIRNYNS